MTLRALNADFPGPAPEPAEAGERITRLKTRRRDSAQAMVVLAAALAAALAWEPAFTAAAAVGVVVAAVAAAWAHAVFSDLLDECSMYPCMSGQPEVAERQRRLIEPDRLASLARRLHRLVDEGPQAAASTGVEGLVVRARIRAVRPRLLALADVLERGTTADPVAVARLWTLLRMGLTSPPSSRMLTSEQLDAILHQALWRMTVEGRPVTPAPRSIAS